MTYDEKQQVIDFIGEKWVITFTNEDGSKNMAFCNSYKKIPELIDIIRKHSCRNIIITDKTSLFID